MKRRKLLAIVIAIAMIALQTPAVFAADLTDGTANGQGTVNYIDPTSFVDTVVPTDASLGFTLDPQNLAEIQGVGVWDPTGGNGAIIPAAVGTIANKSAIPVSVSVKFTLADTTVSPGSKAVLVGAPGAVSTGTAKNMYLSFVPANGKTSIAMSQKPITTVPTYVSVSGTPIAFAKADLLAAGVNPAELLLSTAAATAGFGTYVETGVGTEVYNQVQIPANPAVVPATTATTVTGYDPLRATTHSAVMLDATAGTDLAYVLDKADYDVVRTNATTPAAFTLKYDGGLEAGTPRNDNYDTASFILYGSINKNADWSGYGGSGATITVSAAYTFTILTDTEYSTAIGTKTEATYNSVVTGPVQYALTAGTATNGSVAFYSDSAHNTQITKAAEDDTVYVVATPDSTYQFDSWSSLSGISSLTGSGATSFTMPANAVTVGATFATMPTYSSAGFIVGGTTVNSLSTNVVSSKASSTNITIPFYTHGDTIASVGWGSAGFVLPTSEYTYDAATNTLTLLKGDPSCNLRTASVAIKAAFVTLTGSPTTKYTFNIDVQN